MRWLIFRLPFSKTKADPTADQPNRHRQAKPEPADGWDEPRRRGYPPFFGPPPSILNDKEFNALWHLPALPNTAAPHLIKWATAVSPPPDYALVHAIKSPNGKYQRKDKVWRRVICTYTLEDGTVYDIGITEEGCLRGMLITGMPGSGKTVFAETVVLNSIARDDGKNKGKGRNRSQLMSNGSIVSDPNRDFSFDLLDRIPDWYEPYVVFVDALDPVRVASLNPLYVPGEFTPQAVRDFKDTLGATLPTDAERELLRQIISEEAQDDTAISAVCSAILELFCASLGISMDSTPNVYRFFANSVQLIAELDRTATFWTIKRLLDDNHYRRAMVERSRNTLTKPYWQNDFEELIEKGNINSIQNRMEKLLRNLITARFFCQRKRTIDFRQIADDGYCAILCYSPDLGEEKPFIMRLSGKQLQLGIFSRAGDSEKADRRQTDIFYDEFQESVGEDPKTAVRISEQIRKYGGASCLLHQNFEQVMPTVLRSLQSNTGSLVGMLVGDEERNFYAKAFAGSNWPPEQITQTMKELPQFSMVPRLFDNGKKFGAFVGKNPRRKPLVPDKTPLLVAHRLSEKTLEYPLGYRLEAYDPDYNEAHRGIVETYAREGVEGFYRVTLAGREAGYMMVEVNDGRGQGGLESLIEELTRFFYRQQGENPILTTTNWRLVAWEEREAAAWGLTPQRIAEINNNPQELARYHKLLLEIEMLPPKARTDFLSDQQKLSEEDWQLYRAARYGRDLVLWQILVNNPGLIPSKRSRLITLSRLKYAVPVAEIEAEHTRPDIFTEEANKRHKREMDEEDAEALAEILNPTTKKSAGKGKGKK